MGPRRGISALRDSRRSLLLASIGQSALVAPFSNRCNRVTSSRVGLLEMFRLTAMADIWWPLSKRAQITICTAIFSHIIGYFCAGRTLFEAPRPFGRAVTSSSSSYLCCFSAATDAQMAPPAASVHPYCARHVFAWKAKTPRLTKHFDDDLLSIGSVTVKLEELSTSTDCGWSRLRLVAGDHLLPDLGGAPISESAVGGAQSRRTTLWADHQNILQVLNFDHPYAEPVFRVLQSALKRPPKYGINMRRSEIIWASTKNSYQEMWG